jgi:hypothetical protein
LKQDRGKDLKVIRLRILDVDTCIETDSAYLAELFETMYQRFLSSDNQNELLTKISCRLVSGKDNLHKPPEFRLNGELLKIHPDIDLDMIAPDLILNTIFKQVRHYLIIHSSVIALNGKGVLIAADSGGGKTTLALELVKRGFNFLSDEIAPIGRIDGLVHPFPRTLNLRPGTLSLLELGPRTTHQPPSQSLFTCDIEKLLPGSLGKASQIDTIIILKPGDYPSKENGAQYPEFGLLLDRADESIFSYATSLEGVQSVAWGEAVGCPLLKVRAQHRMRVLSSLETICRERGLLIIDVYKRQLARPSFEGPTHLQAISKTQTVIDLLRQFQAGHESVLLREEFGGSPRRLFLELVNLIENASCFCLTPGSLAQMADLVEEQVRGG